MTPPLPIDFQPYLKSLTTNDKYRRRWRLYTPTDAIGEFQPVHEEPGLDLELMVALFQPQQQTDDCSQKSKVNPEEPKKLPVLQGIHQYLAEANHVLLVGRPGLGKSTVLLRLLVEQAQEALRDLSAKIPVLLELRYLDAHQPVVLDRIEAFLRNHNLNVEVAALKIALAEGRFLLLIDGVNELSSEAARRAVDRFRQDYSQSQMVFTTRDVALGGDLGIASKLEMQLLSDSQIQQFIRAYLPAQEQSMLQQLRGRARELGKTPLFLEMLCQVFEKLKQIPGSLGLLFQCFVGGYEKLKQSVPTSEGFRYWKADLLRHLAFTMLKAGKPTNLQISIPRLDAEAILAEFLQGKVDYPAQRAKEWLEDLLEHHLIQLVDSHQLEFHHQLIQEYYAAESLLCCLPQLSDEELKQDYLNYLKWTEPVALMLALVEEESQALRVVRLAMDEVDLMLGARLAGEVKPVFQSTTVGWIDQKELPIELKVRCWAAGRSEASIESLLLTINDSSSFVGNLTAKALGLIGTEKAVDALLKSLQQSNNIIYMEGAVRILEKVGGSRIINNLRMMLKDPKSKVRSVAASTLGRIGGEMVLDDLLLLLNDLEPEVQQCAAGALGEIGSEKAIDGLIQLLYHTSIRNRYVATIALGKIGHWRAIDDLLAILKYDSDPSARWAAAIALGDIGDPRAVDGLLLALKDPHSWVCSFAATSLGEIGSQQAVDGLRLALQSSDRELCQSAAKALKKIRGEISLDIQDTDAKNDSIEQFKVTAKPWDAKFLRILWENQLKIPETVIYPFINATQYECQFYNYELWQAAESISTQPQPTNMTEKPEYNAKYVAHGNLTVVEGNMDVKGDNVIGNKYVHNYFGADPALNQEIADLQQFIASLEAANPSLKTEQEADQIVTTALDQVQTQEPTRWQTIRRQMGILKQQILNPERHLQAAKATAIEVAKDAVENSLIVKAIITYIDKLSETPDQGA